jgi:GDP-L-fucose synthase
MNILVTGSTGFLGKCLCRALQAQGHQVIPSSSKTCNLQNADSLNQFNKERFDQIYHLAVWTQAGDFCMHHPGEQWVINQKINTNMLDWWQRKQPQAKMISIGTSCAFDPIYPLDEEHYLAGTPIESLVGYGMTKRMLLCGLQALQKQYGLDYLFLIPSTLYGIDGYHNDGKQLHFIFDVVKKILRGKFYGEPVVLWGDGEQKREIIHVDDFVSTMIELVEKTKNEVINIGAGKEHSIKEFALMACQAGNFPFTKIEFDTRRYVGAKSKVLLIEKLLKMNSSFNSRDPTIGIKELVDWLSEHPTLL